MKISNNCYVVYGLSAIPPWVVNAGFIAGSEKTLIVDTGGNYLSAQTIFGYSKAVKPENELIVINTEPHSDHIGGNCFFSEMGINIYGHEKLERNPESINDFKSDYRSVINSKVRLDNNEEEQYYYKTQIVNPNKKLTDETKIDLGNIRVDIIFTPGHTESNISVYEPSEQVLFCGDLIVNGYIPNLDEGRSQDWKIWIESLNRIKRLKLNKVVSGHGEVLSGKQIFDEIDRIEMFLNNAILNETKPTMEIKNV